MTRWRLETTPVRTRKIDVETGEAIVVLEGWLQREAVWLPGGDVAVLCSEGEVDLDLADPEIGSLPTLRAAFPGPDRVVRVHSSGLLHVLGADGAYRYHVKVDADHVRSDPDRGVVVLTRKRKRGWQTAVLAATPAGLAVAAKYREARDDDDGVAPAGAWRTTVIEDGLDVEPPPPPPPERIDLGTLALVRTHAVRPTAPEREDTLWRSWAPVIATARGADAAWAMVRLHKALCEVIRVEPTAAHLPVEGFDRVYTADRGRLIAVTLDHAPPELAFTCFVADDAGVLRYLGRLGHVVDAMWDAGDGAHVALLGGEVYRIERRDAALDPRPLRALVFDVPGHYGRREFLPRYDHDVGFIDRAGALAIEPQFTSAGDFEGGVVAAAHCGPRLFGLVDRDGRLVVPHHHSWIGALRGGCRRIGRGEPNILGEPPGEALWGLIAADGAVVLAPGAITVLDMAEDRAAVERAPGRWNLVTRDGAWLLADDADGCGTFGDGLCPVRRGDRWGYVDRDGRWAIEPAFAHATDFAGGRARVRDRDDGGWRLLAPDGRLVGDPFDDVGVLRDGLARVRIGDRWGYADADGAIAVPPRFDAAFDVCDGFGVVQIGDRWTWIDRAGRLLGEPRFDRTYDFQGGVAIFQRGAYQGFVATTGDVIADKLEQALPLVEDRAAVCQRARWGFLDRTGAFVIRPRFAAARSFSEGLAAVRSGGAWGFVDPSGATVIAPTLGACGSFHDGRARVTARAA